MFTISVLPIGQQQDWPTTRRGCEYAYIDNSATSPETTKYEQTSDRSLISAFKEEPCGTEDESTSLFREETQRQSFGTRDDVITGNGEEHASDVYQVTNVRDCDRVYKTLIFLIESRTDLLNCLFILLEHLVVLGRMKGDNVKVLWDLTNRYIHHLLYKAGLNCHVNVCPHNQTHVDESSSHSIPVPSKGGEFVQFRVKDRFHHQENDQIQLTLAPVRASEKHSNDANLETNRQVIPYETKKCEMLLARTEGSSYTSGTLGKPENDQTVLRTIPPPPPLLLGRHKGADTSTSIVNRNFPCNPRSSIVHHEAVTSTTCSKDEQLDSLSDCSVKISSNPVQLPLDLATRKQCYGTGRKLLRWSKLNKVNKDSIWDNHRDPSTSQPWLDLEQLTVLFNTQHHQDNVACHTQPPSSGHSRFNSASSSCNCTNNTDNGQYKQRGNCSSRSCMHSVGDGHNESIARTRRRSISRGTSEVKLLDRQRCVNISIFLRQFRPSGLNVISLIRHQKTGYLTADHLRGLIKLLPNEKEVYLLKEFKRNVELLDPAEQFLVHLVHTSNYRSVIHYMLLREEFHTYLKSINEAISTTSEVVQDLLSSSAWQSLFQTILEIGNKLNEGSSYGEAQGFRLDTLLKLGDVKSRTSKMTLLHYLLQQVQHHRPEFLEVKSYLPRIKAAVEYSKSEISDRLRTLKLRVNDLQQQLSGQGDQRRYETDEFVNDAVVKLKSTEAQVETLASFAKRCSAYFCEDFASFRLHDCLTTLQIFLEKLNKAETEVFENQNLDTIHRDHRRVIGATKGFQKHDSQRQLSISQHTEDKLFEILASENSKNATTTLEREGIQRPDVHRSMDHDSSVEVTMSMPTSFVQNKSVDLGQNIRRNYLAESMTNHKTLVSADSGALKTGESMIECLEVIWKTPRASRRRSVDTMANRRLDLAMICQPREREFTQSDLHPPGNGSTTTMENTNLSDIRRDLSESSDDDDVTIRAN